ncbi:hypothetical protein ACIA8K_18530 [Catenuloplanes sp. NPDC051500]|uniref:hypothetical protein n=1 Tax=Catenuloplanes sp. NPDC051500 TaxID=3363959 RepID=UPI0037A0CDD6
MVRRVTVRIVGVGVAVLVGAGVALAGTRLLLADDSARTGAPPVAGQENGRDPDVPLTNAARAIASNRLEPAGPQSLFDNRSSEPLKPGAEVNVSLLDVAEASTAVVLAVSALDATRAGAVTVTSSAGTIPAMRLAGPGGQTSSTLIVPIAGDGALRVRDEAGGRLVVQLAGTLTPSFSATDGRVVPVPSREIFRLVKATEGHEKELALDAVLELSGKSVSAVLLQVAADVGVDGGFVRAGDEDRQELFWSATKGADRTRGGLMLVPLDGDKITIHYEAGTELRADLVGYVTGPDAPQSAEGLIVLVPPPSPSESPNPSESASPSGAAGPDGVGNPSRTTGPSGAGVPSSAADRTDAADKSGTAGPSGAGDGGVSGEDVGAEAEKLTVIPAAGLAGVPFDRIGGAFLRVTAQGAGTGEVAVRGGATTPVPAAADQGNPTMLAAAGLSRSTLTLVTVTDGEVSASAEAGAALTLTPEAVLLTAP